MTTKEEKKQPKTFWNFAGPIVLAVVGLITLAITTLGTSWFYRTFTRAEVYFKVSYNSQPVQNAKVILDKDTSNTTGDGVTIFDDRKKGKHSIYTISYNGQVVSGSFSIPDTAKRYLVIRDIPLVRPGQISKPKERPGHRDTSEENKATPPVENSNVEDNQPRVVVQVKGSPLLEKTFAERPCNRHRFIILNDHFKFWVDEIGDDNASANLQICYSAQSNSICTNVIQEDINIKINIPYTFNDHGKGYKIRISRLQGRTAFLILEQYDKQFEI